MMTGFLSKNSSELSSQWQWVSVCVLCCSQLTVSFVFRYKSFCCFYRVLFELISNALKHHNQCRESRSPFIPRCLEFHDSDNNHQSMLSKSKLNPFETTRISVTDWKCTNTPNYTTDFMPDFNQKWKTYVSDICTKWLQFTNFFGKIWNIFKNSRHWSEFGHSQWSGNKSNL